MPERQPRYLFCRVECRKPAVVQTAKQVPFGATGVVVFLVSKANEEVATDTKKS